MDRFRYQVTPFSPIKELIPGQSINRPFTTDLTKEEVFICMKHGPVYRAFHNQPLIKVTGENIDKLHRKALEEEKTENQSNHTENAENVIVEDKGSVEEPKTDAPTEQEVVENHDNEIKEENSVVEEASDDTTVEAETKVEGESTDVENHDDETKEETPELEEVKDSDLDSMMVESEPVAESNNHQEQKPQYNTYNNKKKKHH